MENNNELLRMLDMPVFFNTKGLANLIHMDEKRVNSLVMRSERFYKRYPIKKKSGGLREIRQPNPDQKAIQAWILRNILDKLSVSAHSTAFIRGKDQKANVEPHRNNRFFYALDIKDFFDSIIFSQVYKIFNIIGYSPRVSWALTKLCTCSGSLPQGGVTSPALSNLVCFKMDRRISAYTSRKNIIYTRYADDITFSARNAKVLQRVVPVIKKIIESEGFQINDSKVRFSGPYNSTSITGLVKNASLAKFGIGRDKKRILRAKICNYFRKGYLQTPKNLEHIVGWLNYTKSVDEESFIKLKTFFDIMEIKAKQK